MLGFHFVDRQRNRQTEHKLNAPNLLMQERKKTVLHIYCYNQSVESTGVALSTEKMQGIKNWGK